MCVCVCVFVFVFSSGVFEFSLDTMLFLQYCSYPNYVVPSRRIRGLGFRMQGLYRCIRGSRVHGLDDLRGPFSRLATFLG